MSLQSSAEFAAFATGFASESSVPLAKPLDGSLPASFLTSAPFSTHGPARIATAPGAELVPSDLLEPPWRSESRGMFRDLAGLLLDRHLRRLSRMRSPVEWRVARILERLDRGSSYLDLGFARLSDYATERLGLTARRVQTLVALARRLAPLPHVACAWESGALSQSQAALLSRVATPADEERWVARASSLTVRRLTQEVREALAAREAASAEQNAGTDGVSLNEVGLLEVGPLTEVGPPKEDPLEEDEPGAMVAFTMPARLRPLWEEALELARRSSGAAEPVYRCVEFIAADFLAGAPDLPRLLADALTEPEPTAEANDRSGIVTDDDRRATCATSDGIPQGTDATPDGIAQGTDTDDGTDLFEEILTALEKEGGVAADTHGVAAEGAEIRLPEEAQDRADDTPRLLDLRLRTLVALRQDLAWHQGRLLRILAGRRLHRDLGFLSFHRFCVERAGLGARRAWQLIALDRRLMCLPRLGAAYRAGEISWVRASAVARVATEATEADWIRLALSVTVRRLHEEVALAMAADEAAEVGPLSRRPSGGVRPPGLGSDGRVQLSAPRARPAPDGDDVDDGERRDGGEPHDDVERRVPIRFWAPLETVSLWRQAVGVSRFLLLRERTESATAPNTGHNPKPIEWECVERIVQTFVADWSVRQTTSWQRRYRIFERDGWRCRVPGCSSRSNLQVHHVVFRSHGGDDDDGNLAVLCATHHLQGIHQGRLRCHALPDGLLAWEFAPDPVAGALSLYVEDVTWDAAALRRDAGRGGPRDDRRHRDCGRLHVGARQVMDPGRAAGRLIRHPARAPESPVPRARAGGRACVSDTG